MFRHSVIFLLLFVVFHFDIINSKSKMRILESKMNIMNSKLAMLETKVFNDGLEFRDSIELILKQLNDTDHGTDDDVDTFSGSRGPSDENRHTVTGAVERLESIQNGFKNEKRHIRNLLHVFKDSLTDMQEQLEIKANALLENTVQKVKTVANNLTATEVEMKKMCEEMQSGFSTKIQDISTELKVCLNSNNKMKQFVDELSRNVSTNRANIDVNKADISDAQVTLENMNSAVGKIQEAPSLKCGSWTGFGMSCYKAFLVYTTWEDAARTCTANEAYLVEIESSDELEFVVKHVNLTLDFDVYEEYDFLTYYYEDFGNAIWIGATDKESEGTWLWDYSRRLLTRTFSRWQDGEPNGGSGENCAHLRMHDGRWSGGSCYAVKAYVCEKPVTAK